MKQVWEAHKAAKDALAINQFHIDILYIKHPFASPMCLANYPEVDFSGSIYQECHLMVPFRCIQKHASKLYHHKD